MLRVIKSQCAPPELRCVIGYSIEWHRFELLCTSGPREECSACRENRSEMCALREWSANLRTATAGLWITVGREGCQPALRFSNQYCVPCQLLAGRRGFWRNSVTSGVQGIAPKRQAYCMFSTETNPDFKKQKGWCFIYFCILQQGLFLTGFIWLFLLIQLLSILAHFFLWLRWWPCIIIHLQNSNLNYNASLTVRQGTV